MAKQVHLHLCRMAGNSWIVPANIGWRAGDVGTVVDATIYVAHIDGDEHEVSPMRLESATVTILLCGAAGRIDKPAVIIDAAAGLVRIVIAAGDLVAGPLAIRARVDLSGGQVSHTGAVLVRVEPICA